MYGWIWRTLPGGRAGKFIGSLVLFLAATAVLFLFVFPWVDPQLPWNNQTVR